MISDKTEIGLLFSASALCFIMACSPLNIGPAAWNRAGVRASQDLLKQAQDENGTLIAQRNLYKDMSARAHADLLVEKKKVLAAYARGVKYGAAGVKCIAKWQPLPEK